MPACCPALARRRADPGRRAGGRRQERCHDHCRWRPGWTPVPPCWSRRSPSAPRGTAALLHDQLAEIGARLIVQALAERPVPKPQPEEGVSYAAKLTRADGVLDWRHPATALDRQVRALNPWPGTWCHLGGEVLKVARGRAGDLEDQGRTRHGATRVRDRMRRGRALGCCACSARAGRPWRPRAFCAGSPVTAGTVLGAA